MIWGRPRAENSQQSRRRPQFSLKMLLIAVTAVAIGSAVWWRWPITETVARLEVSDVDGSTYQIYETFTYHRGIRGDLIKHGLHRQTQNGQVWLEDRYREGVLHGPVFKWPGITGEYYGGEKHGTWEYGIWEKQPSNAPLFAANPVPRALSIRDSYRAVEHWNRGGRDGLFQWWDSAGKLCFSHEFKRDQLVIPPETQSKNLLLRRMSQRVEQKRTEETKKGREQKVPSICHTIPSL